MGLPIISATSDRETGTPIIIYTPVAWDKADGTPIKWEETRPEPIKSAFRIIHDAQVITSTTGGLDKVLVSGREGVSLVWVDETTKQWRHENVGVGIPQSRRPLKNPYWGAGSVATGRVGNDSVAYIASCEVSSTILKTPYLADLNHNPGIPWQPCLGLREAPWHPPRQDCYRRALA